MRYNKTSKKHRAEIEMLMMYDEQDKHLINEMIRDYKIFHTISTMAILWFIITTVVIITCCVV